MMHLILEMLYFYVCRNQKDLVAEQHNYNEKSTKTEVDKATIWAGE